MLQNRPRPVRIIERVLLVIMIINRRVIQPLRQQIPFLHVSFIGCALALNTYFYVGRCSRHGTTGIYKLRAGPYPSRLLLGKLNPHGGCGMVVKTEGGLSVPCHRPRSPKTKGDAVASIPGPGTGRISVRLSQDPGRPLSMTTIWTMPMSRTGRALSSR